MIYVALLRAVNVGGTGKLSMAELRALCESIGFEEPRTYIQSGNVVFRSKLPEAKVKATLEKALAKKMGKPTKALVRSAKELRATLEHNPFSAAETNRVIVVFLDEAPPKSALRDVRIPGREELEVRGREIFVHYPDGQGHSKLKVPFSDRGTGRNLNTVAKLIDMMPE
jgi:uncharacterized protein (DUF1697 family)